MPLTLHAEVVRRPLIRPFSISTGSRTHVDVLAVRATDGPHTGRGEATGVRYRGDTADSMLGQLRTLDTDALDRASLQHRLPPGGARSAVDAALWDLAAAWDGTTVATLLGLDPQPVASAYTVVLDTPAAMQAQAREEAWRPLLKAKLGGSPEHEAARIRAVRSGAPDTRLVLDANAGWTPGQLRALAPVAAECGYELIEQPLPVGTPAEGAWPLPLCADESFQTTEDFARVPWARTVNIKLDKCGGLTAALGIVAEARERGLRVFVGCMVAPTVALAPAHLLAQTADYADLDGPFWFPDEPARLLPDGTFAPIPPDVWGGGA